ncbi:hypothetical protein PVK06_036535 [Gossypium arboreum]|uniref:Uncharacterized protein n=1 Tax=Gossypium arboreum TaxID=29729 RepID=A0ABR0NJT8_GOSAR|nr:hypothetical protein PVK06_036535 [Gossypium arboreum]
MHLSLDADVQKLKAEKLRKGKRKVEEDLDNLKTDYKKLHMSMRTAELEKTLNRIENLKGKAGELEIALQNCELRIEFHESNNEQWKEQLHRSQDQVRERDYVMAEAVAQIREVADHLQTLAVQADVLSVTYELELDRGRELA